MALHAENFRLRLAVKMGQKHNLEFINVLTDDGLMNENAGPFRGQKRFDVRYSIQEELKKKGLYVDKKDVCIVCALMSMRTYLLIYPRIP